jgi:hypothetical protein
MKKKGSAFTRSAPPDFEERVVKAASISRSVPA